MSLDTLKTLESLRGCEFTPEQAEVVTGILIEREEDLVTKADLKQELAGVEHQVKDVQRDVDQLRKDMEAGFALMEQRLTRIEETTERRFAEMQESMEREFARQREEYRRDLEYAMAEQRRHTDAVAEQAALSTERSKRETLLAMIVVAGVVIAAVGLIVALV